MKVEEYITIKKVCRKGESPRIINHCVAWRWWRRAHTKVRWRRWKLLLQTRVGSLSDITLCLVSVSTRRGGSSSYFHLLRVCLRARVRECARVCVCVCVFHPPRSHTHTSIGGPFLLLLPPIIHTHTHIHTRH